MHKFREITAKIPENVKVTVEKKISNFLKVFIEHDRESGTLVITIQLWVTSTCQRPIQFLHPSQWNMYLNG